MTMPPLAPRRRAPAGTSPPAELAVELAALVRASRFDRLSMGTSQDYLVAVEEGATIVRLDRPSTADPSV